MFSRLKFPHILILTKRFVPQLMLGWCAKSSEGRRTSHFKAPSISVSRNCRTGNSRLTSKIAIPSKRWVYPWRSNLSLPFDRGLARSPPPVPAKMTHFLFKLLGGLMEQINALKQRGCSNWCKKKDEPVSIGFYIPTGSCTAGVWHGYRRKNQELLPGCELMAQIRFEVWSWDITYLPTNVKGIWLYL